MHAIYLIHQSLHPLTFPIILGLYFLLLMGIGYVTSKKSDNRSFFTGNRNSPWFLVAFGMIGASLSGVTFLSIPGTVFKDGYTYMQLVAGYFFGYLVIQYVLLPLYYKLNLTSIYTYLQSRFGNSSYKTGAFYFLLSRSIGSALRLYLVALVLQTFVSDKLGISFEWTVFSTILLIWLYSFKGGIKTIVYTDTLQTLFMLTALGVSIVFLWNQIGSSDAVSVVEKIKNAGYAHWFVGDTQPENSFWKSFFGGMFITIVMTGLDQDMMQKSLTCRNLNDARKNVLWTSILLIPVNFLFLTLGALLFTYSIDASIILPNPENTEALALAAKQGKVFIFTMPDGLSQLISKDEVFSNLAAFYLPTTAAIFFFIGLVAAAYSTADSALTSLTTSFCIDFLGFSQTKGTKKTRQWVHVGFSLLLFVIILVFKSLNRDAVIYELFKVAGYTYGPLLGLYAFGLFTKLKVHDKFVPLICLLSPVICFMLDYNSKEWLFGYKFGFELLILNGLITFVGLGLLRIKSK